MIRAEPLKSFLEKLLVWPTAPIMASLVAFPRLAPVFLVLMALTAWPFLRLSRKAPLAVLKNTTAFWVFLAFGGYLLVNALWAADVSKAMEKAVFFVFLVLLAAMVVPLSAALGARERQILKGSVLIGLIFGGSLLLVELLFGSPLTAALLNHFPQLVSKKFKNVLLAAPGGPVVGTMPDFFNNHVAMLALLAWPAIAMGLSHAKGSPWRWLGWGLASLTTLVVFLSHNESAKVGWLLGLVSLPLVLHVPKFTRYVFLLGWFVGVVFVVPLILAAYQLGLQHVDWLPYSARDRVYVWHYLAQKVPESPLLGIGIRSTRAIAEDFRRQRQESRASGREGPVQGLMDRPGQHPHDLFLQTWLELGAVGAVFLLFLGWYVIRAMDTLSRWPRAYAYALFSVFLGIAAFAWGMWQTWLMSAYLWSFLLFQFYLREAETIPLREK